MDIQLKRGLLDVCVLEGRLSGKIRWILPDGGNQKR